MQRTGNDRDSALKHLLIVYHSKTGNTQLLTDAVVHGAMNCEVTAVELRVLRAPEAGPEDLLWADALRLGTPELVRWGMGVADMDRLGGMIAAALRGRPAPAAVAQWRRHFDRMRFIHA